MMLKSIIYNDAKNKSKFDLVAKRCRVFSVLAPSSIAALVAVRDYIDAENSVGGAEFLDSANNDRPFVCEPVAIIEGGRYDGGNNFEVIRLQIKNR